MRRVALAVFAAVGGIIVALTYSVPRTYAALPAEGQLPVGTSVTITMRTEEGQESASGTLVAADEQWLVLRDSKSLLTWYNAACIRKVGTGGAPTQAAPAPAPAPAPEAPPAPAPEAAPAPAPAPAPEAAPAPAPAANS